MVHSVLAAGGLRSAPLAGQASGGERRVCREAKDGLHVRHGAVVPAESVFRRPVLGGRFADRRLPEQSRRGLRHQGGVAGCFFLLHEQVPPLFAERVESAEGVRAVPDAAVRADALCALRTGARGGARAQCRVYVPGGGRVPFRRPRVLFQAGVQL